MARKHLFPIVHLRVTFGESGTVSRLEQDVKPHVHWGRCDTLTHPSGPTGVPGATTPPQALVSWGKGLTIPVIQKELQAAFGLLDALVHHHAVSVLRQM